MKHYSITILLSLLFTSTLTADIFDKQSNETHRIHAYDVFWLGTPKEDTIDVAELNQYILINPDDNCAIDRDNIPDVVLIFKKIKPGSSTGKIIRNAFTFLVFENSVLTAITIRREERTDATQYQEDFLIKKIKDSLYKTMLEYARIQKIKPEIIKNDNLIFLPHKELYIYSDINRLEIKDSTNLTKGNPEKVAQGHIIIRMKP